MNLTIKQFAERFGVSHRLVRYYDDIGLLHPSMRHSNGYRGYNEDDLERFKRILVLRRFGFSLKEIIFLNEECPNFSLTEEKIVLLTKRMKSLEDEEKRISGALYCLRNFIPEANEMWSWAAEKMGIVK